MAGENENGKKGVTAGCSHHSGIGTYIESVVKDLLLGEYKGRARGGGVVGREREVIQICSCKE